MLRGGRSFVCPLQTSLEVTHMWDSPRANQGVKSQTSFASISVPPFMALPFDDLCKTFCKHILNNYGDKHLYVIILYHPHTPCKGRIISPILWMKTGSLRGWTTPVQVARTSQSELKPESLNHKPTAVCTSQSYLEGCLISTARFPNNHQFCHIWVQTN